MYKGLRHTAACSKCGETTIPCITYAELEMVTKNKKSECCNAPYEYVGLQPYRETIIKGPVLTVENTPVNADKKTKDELEEVKMEIVKNENEKPEVTEETVNQEVEVVTAEATNEEVNVVEETNETEEKEVTPEETSKIQTPTVEVVSSSDFNVEDIIDTSSKVNNAKMIPALKAAMEELNHDKVAALQKAFPDVFNASLKYIPKKLRKPFGLEENPA